MTRPEEPVVVALMGLPGSGKTTLAEALAPRIPARTVSRDALRATMFRPCTFTDAERDAAFEAVVRAVSVNCRLGHSTVVDGMPFSRKGELELVMRASGDRTLAVLCSVPVEEAQRRIREQGDAAAPAAEDRDPELVADVAARFRPVPAGTLELDARRPVGELVRAVLGALRASGRPSRSRPACS